MHLLGCCSACCTTGELKLTVWDWEKSRKQELSEHWLSSKSSCVASWKGFDSTFFFLATVLRTLSARLFSTRLRFGRNVASSRIFLLSLTFCIKVFTRWNMLYLHVQTKRVQIFERTNKIRSPKRKHRDVHVSIYSAATKSVDRCVINRLSRFELHDIACYFQAKQWRLY